MSQHSANQRRTSRRGFLRLAAAAAGGLALRPSRARAFEGELIMPPGADASRVVQVTSAHATDGPTVHRTVLGEMLDQALTTLTGKGSATTAWRSLLGTARVIGLKFNRSGQTVIGTTETVAEVLVASLSNAGWPPEQVVCIEAPDGTADRLGTTRPRPGFDPYPTDFGSGSDQFATVLTQIDALVSVPFLKTHNIAGLTASLKNLSHGLVKHPARYHAQGCAPFVGDIVAAPPIRSKLRLVVIDGLRVVFTGGPTASVERLSDAGILAVSTDPVAADAVGLSLLNGIRRRQALPQLAQSPSDIPYLAASHRSGLGIAVPHGIDHVALTV